VHIVAILGSARKNGTSARIARAFTEIAVTYGAAVTEYPLNTMQYRGCQGCEGCHTRAKSCVLRDDLTPLLDQLYRADVVVLAAPVYFGDTCGQFKCCYDRLWSLMDVRVGQGTGESRLPPGKTAVLILSHVAPSGTHSDVVDRYTEGLELYGFAVQSLVAPGLRIEPNTDIDTHLARAAALARELMRAG
jgi:NAD(P)H-dependent FMN reductase